MKKTCCCEDCKHPKQRHPVVTTTYTTPALKPGMSPVRRTRSERGPCDYPTCDCKAFL